MTGSDRNRARKNRLVEALLSGAHQRQAAAYAGVSERTVRRWLADPGFQRRLQEAEAGAIRDVQRRVVAATIRAVDMLDELVADADAPAYVRVQAGRALLAAFAAQQPSRLELDATITPTVADQDSAIDRLRRMLAEAQANRQESDHVLTRDTRRGPDQGRSGPDAIVTQLEDRS